jgi:hypothetical protein
VRRARGLLLLLRLRLRRVRVDAGEQLGKERRRLESSKAVSPDEQLHLGLRLVERVGRDASLRDGFEHAAALLRAEVNLLPRVR